MAEKKSAPGQRLPAAERREQMLNAACIVFGERGCAGTTTDAVAKAAGVSQAYIVRTFGSKENLFAETASRAVDKTIEVFRTVAQGVESPQELLREMGHAYVKLVADRGILLTMCDNRTNLYKTLTEQVEEMFQGRIKVFQTKIPKTVKVGEAIYSGQSIKKYAKGSSVDVAYDNLAKEICHE